MSSPAEQFPPDPDDPGHDARAQPHDRTGAPTPRPNSSPDSGAHAQTRRRRRTLQEQARATLA
ncbi:MAG: hypothetical protein ABWY68_06810, partial [Cryobacterium sp.]